MNWAWGTQGQNELGLGAARPLDASLRATWPEYSENIRVRVPQGQNDSGIIRHASLSQPR